MRKHVSQADLQASIQPRVGGYNKNNDRSRGLVGVVATIQGAQRDYVIIGLSLLSHPFHIIWRSQVRVLRQANSLSAILKLFS